MINIAGIIYYTCSLVMDIERTRNKNVITNIFNQLCVEITLLRSKNNSKEGM